MRLHELEACAIEPGIRFAAKKILLEAHRGPFPSQATARGSPRSMLGTVDPACGARRGPERMLCDDAQPLRQRGCGDRRAGGPARRFSYEALSARVLQCGIAESNVGGTKRMLSEHGAEPD
jgi:hypothetical protein